MEKKIAFLGALLIVLLLWVVSFRGISVFSGRGRKGEIPVSMGDRKLADDKKVGYITLPKGRKGAVKYSGKVVPASDFSVKEGYELLDSDGKFLILLTADDAKLKLAEGRFVEVSGTLEKNAAGEKVLRVESVSFK